MIIIPHIGLFILIAFAALFLASWLMKKQERLFFTVDPLKRKFSMLEMEFPAKSYDLEYLIEGIYHLPAGEPEITVKAVRRQLLLDYLLFIPSVYTGIFLLSMHVAVNIPFFVGQYIFAALAWAQIIPFMLDYIENTYFWIKVGKKDQEIPKPEKRKKECKPGEKEEEIIPPSFTIMKWLEGFKWGIPLVTLASCIAVLAYFWLNGTF